jgi:hypothetical protein
VPTGYTTIVKSLHITNAETAAMNINVTVKTAGGLQLYLFNAPTFAASTVQYISTWAVLEQGDALCWGANGVNAMILAGGAELID